MCEPGWTDDDFFLLNPDPCGMKLSVHITLCSIELVLSVALLIKLLFEMYRVSGKIRPMLAFYSVFLLFEIILSSGALSGWRGNSWPLWISFLIGLQMVMYGMASRQFVFLEVALQVKRLNAGKVDVWPFKVGVWSVHFICTASVIICWVILQNGVYRHKLGAQMMSSRVGWAMSAFQVFANLPPFTLLTHRLLEALMFTSKLAPTGASERSRNNGSRHEKKPSGGNGGEIMLTSNNNNSNNTQQQPQQQRHPYATTITTAAPNHAYTQGRPSASSNNNSLPTSPSHSEENSAHNGHVNVNNNINKKKLIDDNDKHTHTRTHTLTLPTANLTTTTAIMQRDSHSNNGSNSKNYNDNKPPPAVERKSTNNNQYDYSNRANTQASALRANAFLSVFALILTGVLFVLCASWKTSYLLMHAIFLLSILSMFGVLRFVGQMQQATTRNERAEAKARALQHKSKSKSKSSHNKDKDKDRDKDRDKEIPRVSAGHSGALHNNNNSNNNNHHHHHQVGSNHNNNNNNNNNNNEQNQNNNNTINTHTITDTTMREDSTNTHTLGGESGRVSLIVPRESNQTSLLGVPSPHGNNHAASTAIAADGSAEVVTALVLHDAE